MSQQIARAFCPELEDIVVNIVSYPKSKPVKCRQFIHHCQIMDANHVTLFLHTGVWWLSQGLLLPRFYELRKGLLIFLLMTRYNLSINNKSWWSKCAYICDIFQYLNKLNRSMQSVEGYILHLQFTESLHSNGRWLFGKKYVLRETFWDILHFIAA